ncbi:hypothetical protein BDV19DRAFT_362636 [Aspergillus venezuelensis]
MEQQLQSNPAARVPAAHRALALPELRQCIFDWIWADERSFDFLYTDPDPDSDKKEKEVITILDDDASTHPSKDRFSTLLSCSIVCKSWFEQAMGILWRDVRPGSGSGSGIPIDRVLHIFDELRARMRCIPLDRDSDSGSDSAEVKPKERKRNKTRRQLYANFIKAAATHAWSDSDNDDDDEDASLSDREIRDLVFPRLKTLKVSTVGTCNRLPRIIAPNLTTVELDPGHDWHPFDDWISEFVARDLFGNVATLFPSLEELHLSDYLSIREHHLKKFKDRLPRLRYIDMDFLTVLGDDVPLPSTENGLPGTGVRPKSISWVM